MEISRRDLLTVARRANKYFLSSSTANYVNADFKTMSDIEILYTENVINYIKLCFNMIDDFTNSDISVANYRKKHKYDMYEFDKRIDTVRLLDEDKYNKYMTACKEKEEKVKYIVLKTSKLIAKMLKDGVDGREFDIIDFYRFTGLTIRDYKKYYNKIPVELKKFLEENNVEEYRKKDIEQFLENKIMIGDREFTKEEKMEIIMFLNNRNIPITMFTKSAAMKRLINGNLNERISLKNDLFEDNKEKVKTK